MRKSLGNFFHELELYEDIHSGNRYKKDIAEAVFNFLKKNNESNAYKVYTSFFNAYWIGIQHPDNPFLKLQDTLRKFEENAGRLIDKQRDHYVHSVNVFILGLAIYANNAKYRQLFNSYALNADYPDHYSTRHEEFFYRWGLASLFHDIAYPLEITLKQANQYFDFVWSYPKTTKVKNKSFIDFPNFNKFISLPCLTPSRRFSLSFYQKYPQFSSLKKCNAIDLLAYLISGSLGLKQGDLLRSIDSFAADMKRGGFIDHGFYSAVIMLKWYHFLLKITKWNPAYFFYPILDSSSAILLHNFYGKVLMKKPFRLRALSASRHPIAFLLILCDELQEWNRQPYGSHEPRMIAVNKIKLSFKLHSLKLTYVGEASTITQVFKRASINYKELFKNGIIIRGGE
ncbi:MAG: hypothetical protein WC578_01930 [Candidatus Omnitrophota bacterium]|jgi:hypothetical protein